MKQSPLQKVRERHAKILELPGPTAPAAPDVDRAIYHIDRFLRKPALPMAMILKARVARSSLRGILKLL